MTSTYDRILKKIKSQNSTMVELARRALTWVVTARRPLKPKELALMIAIESSTSRIKELEGKYQAHVAIEACCGFLTGDDGLVRPIHFTVQEFLKMDGDFFPNMSEADSELVRRSIYYFLCKDFRLVNSMLGDGKYMYENAVTGGMAYIFSHWDEHLRRAWPVRADLTALLKTLFDGENRHALYMARTNDFCKVSSVLSLCALFGILEVYEALYHVENSDISSEELKKAVDDAARGGSVRTIQALLSRMNDEDRKNHCSLAEAASHGHTDVVRFFLDRRNKNEDGSSTEISTAFARATFGEWWNVMKMLIESGADVNTEVKRFGTALQCAAIRGKQDMVELLLDKGADVNIGGGSWGSALHAAAQNEDPSIVKILLSRGADPNIQHDTYGTPVEAAVRNGSRKALEILLVAGAKLDGNHSNFLSIAAKKGNEDSFELLLAHGDSANKGEDFSSLLEDAAAGGRAKIINILLARLLARGVAVKENEGVYDIALRAAASSGDEAVVQILLEKGADVNAQGGIFGTALQAAAFRGGETVVQILLDQGADVNAQGGYYGSALQAAASRGDEAVVQILLDQGADVNAQGGQYGSALQAALVAYVAYVGDEGVVRTLLDQGADVNAQGGEYGTALQAAAFKGDETVVQILLDQGADVNAQGGKYGTALQAAAFRGYETVVQILLDQGADVNAQGGQYGTAIQTAAYVRDEAVVRTLLDQGADVNAQCGKFGTALQAAAFRGDKAVVQILLDQGADVNAQGGEYGSALQAAACSYDEGRPAVVQKLLEKGADVNAQGGIFGTALQAAASRGDEAVVKILLDQGANVNAQGGKYDNALEASLKAGKKDIAEILVQWGAVNH
jgi:ankyrin repeat protein